jgi:hypothetical protein
VSKCLTLEELQSAMALIAHSETDNADHLRHLASKALHCGIQPLDLTEAIEGVTSLEGASEGAKSTVIRALNGNTKYVLPRYYLHGSKGKIALVWSMTPEQELLLIFDTNRFEMFKLVKGRVSVHMEYVGYSNGSFDEPIGKNIPLKSS